MLPLISSIQGEVVTWIEMFGTWGIVLVIWLESRALRRQHRSETYRTLLERLQQPEVRESRKKLFAAYDQRITAKLTDEWGEELVQAADTTAIRYEEVAILLRAGAIDEDLLFPMWAGSIAKSWDAAKPFLMGERSRFAKERWRPFEELAKTARKYLDGRA